MRVPLRNGSGAARDRVDRMFQTRSHAWEQAGLARAVSPEARESARRALRQALLLAPLFAGVIVLYVERERVFGRDLDTAVRIGTAIALMALGWALARDIGRAVAPALFRRMDPATAGTVGFLIRLATIGVTLLIALRIAGIQPQTLAVGGAFTAVVLGLAAQQTLGNVIAGTVLLSARPFRVGERIRLQAGPLAGQIEGVVASLGLLYTTLARGADRIMVPNSVVLSSAVVPLREPDSVDLRARLRAEVRPSDVQELLASTVTVATREDPHIDLEEFDGEEVVVRISAAPEHAKDGRRLADEILAAIKEVSRDATTVGRAAGERDRGAAEQPDGDSAQDGSGASRDDAAA